MTPLVALTVAGSDSGGGAGLQADLKTFAAFGIHGTSAVTALTAQHTVGVLGVLAVDPGFVELQIDAVTSDLAPRAVKTGMLATPTIVATVGRLAAKGALPNLVVDPVLVSSTGHALMEDGGVDAYRTLLLPYAAVATPNLFEAALLTGRAVDELSTTDVMVEVAEELRALGTGTVVVKGGHLSGRDGAASSSPDVVAGPSGTAVLTAARVDTPNDHGTGCSLSAAIAALLARGWVPGEAVIDAKRFVRHALVGGRTWRLGAGRGPIDHFGWTSDGPAVGTTVPRS